MTAKNHITVLPLLSRRSCSPRVSHLGPPSLHPPAIEDERVVRVGEELPRNVSVQIRSSPRHNDAEGGTHPRKLSARQRWWSVTKVTRRAADERARAGAAGRGGGSAGARDRRPKANFEWAGPTGHNETGRGG